MTRGRPWSITVAATVGLLILALPVQAQEGEWRLGWRVLTVETDTESESLAESGSRIAFDSAWTVEFDATYMLDADWGIEWMVTTAPHDLQAGGGDLHGLDIGEVWVAQSTITLTYHVPLWGKWRPYLGAGIGTGYLHSADVTDQAESAGISKVKSNLLSGIAAQLGVTYRHGHNWIFNLDLKYSDTSGDVKIEDGSGQTTDVLDTDFGPWLIGLGAAYRF
jgi:outer membrane protein W